MFYPDSELHQIFFVSLLTLAETITSYRNLSHELTILEFTWGLTVTQPEGLKNAKSLSKIWEVFVKLLGGFKATIGRLLYERSGNTENSKQINVIMWVLITETAEW